MTSEHAELLVLRAQLETLRRILATAKSLAVSEVALRRAKSTEREIAKLSLASETDVTAAVAPASPAYAAAV